MTPEEYQLRKRRDYQPSKIDLFLEDNPGKPKAFTHEFAAGLFAQPTNRATHIDDQTFAECLADFIDAPWTVRSVGIVRGQQRFAVARSMAGSLVSRGVDIDVILATVSAWGTLHCLPALTAAESEGVIAWVASKRLDKK